jgi:PDZ domain-containing protein
VALQRLGYEVTEESNHVVISNVLCDGPSFGALQAADEVLSVDDQPVATAEDVGVFVQMHEPGDDVRFNVTRDGIEQELTVRAGHTTKDPNRPCAPGKGGGAGAIACVGIQDQNIVDLKFPFKIEVDTNRVSGPSAGLAFTLAIIDSLTDGSLTGGERVAVTGAILSDGTVVPVGGVEQKAAVASSAGAMLMLVPACPKPLERDCEAEPARAHANGMRVVIVETIDDALRALERAGGDPIPPRPDPATAQ